MALLDIFLRVKCELITSVQRNIEKSIVIVEHGLGTISMVDVPIKDTDSLQTKGLIKGNFCRQSSIIEEAKA